MEGGERPWIIWKVENGRILSMGRSGAWRDAFAAKPNSFPEAFEWMSTNDRTKITEQRARDIAAEWGAEL